jgi:RsiW-degrading membrane proteinase PrsW (M82 family)
MSSFIFRVYMPAIFLTALVSLLMPEISIAAYYAPTGIGQVANNLMDPVFMGANFIGSMAICIGLSFIMASFFKYMQYRRNPMATPISTVVLLLLMGVVLMLLPLAYKLTQSGVRVQL